jgi:hypothetical protein
MDPETGMGMQGLDEVHTRWLYQRVFQLGSTLEGVTTKLNGKSIHSVARNTKDYIGANLLGAHEQDQKQDKAEDDEDGNGAGFDEDRNGSSEDEDEEEEEEEHMESDSEEGGRATPSKRKKGDKLSAEERKARRQGKFDDDMTEAEIATALKRSLIYKRVNKFWEIGFARSKTGEFQQVSMVNNIATTSGGTHVDYVTEQLVNRVIDKVSGENQTHAQRTVFYLVVFDLYASCWRLSQFLLRHRKTRRPHLRPDDNACRGDLS